MHLGLLPLDLLSKLLYAFIMSPMRDTAFPMSINTLLFSGLKLNCGLNMRILRRENMGERGEFEHGQNLNTMSERGKGRGEKRK